MEINIFLLPLLGGYSFVKKSIWFRYRTIRYYTQELLLSSAVAGLVGVTVAFFVATILSAVLPEIQEEWKNLISFEYPGTAILAFLLLLSTAYLPNRLIDEEQQIKNIIKEDNDGIELILLKALEEAKLVSITLQTRKVYIGFVSHHFFNPWKGVKSIRIIPVYSGFRDEKDFHIEFTTSYEHVIRYTDESDEIEFKAEDFQMGISLGEIVSVIFFDNRVYEQFS